MSGNLHPAVEAWTSSGNFTPEQVVKLDKAAKAVERGNDSFNEYKLRLIAAFWEAVPKDEIG